jgi:steroid 5-alpha reductase family enzyme
MTIPYLEALAAIAIALSILMAGAWVVQQRTGNSGWVDTIWTFSVGLVGAGSALWPIGGAAANARQWLVAVLVAIWSLRLGVHIAIRSAGISDDPRYADFAREWGADSPRRMFIFLQNQGLGSIPLAFAIFVIWGQFTDVENTVMRETNTLTDLLRFSEYVPGATLTMARRTFLN